MRLDQGYYEVWVYCTGDPMPLSLAEDRLATILRERESHILGVGGLSND
jgi:hypothetical protein